MVCRGKVKLRLRRMPMVLAVCAQLCVLSVASCESFGTDVLPSWADGTSRQAILGFVETVSDPRSPQYVHPAKRLAVFDCDGTLWPETPIYFEVLFASHLLRGKLPADSPLRDEPALKAVIESDWDGAKELGLEPAVLIAMGLVDERRLATEVEAWLLNSEHPSFGVPYSRLVYQPQLELIEYLRSSGFMVFIVSASMEGFLHGISRRLVGVEPSGVAGSRLAREDQRSEDVAGRLLTQYERKCDGNKKVDCLRLITDVVPILVFGNSEGDVELLQYMSSGSGMALGMLLSHDDLAREGSARPLSDRAVQEAKTNDWLLISMADDFVRLFGVSDGVREGVVELGDVLTIVAILTGPFVAALIALGVEARRRRLVRIESRQESVLYDLVRSRAAFNTPRNRDVLESSLNSIPVVFRGDSEICELYSKAYDAVGSDDFETYLTDLIRVIGVKVGYEDIDSEVLKGVFLFPSDSTSSGTEKAK